MAVVPPKSLPPRTLSVDTGAVLLAFFLAALVRLGLLKNVPW